jgi:ferredoxin--NADP+ reductase
VSRSVAIVGAGPSGCYLAQALLKATAELDVDLIDRLPVPYGLVRYGVAPDHQGTKAVIRQFERLFERQGAHFFGNVAVDRPLLEALRKAYDAVVLAAGLSSDRRLGIPGEELDGVIRAGELTRALYDHPDATGLPRLGRKIVLMGNGNVAIDLLRLLAKTPEELAGSDLGPGASEWLARSPAEEITIVGRSPAASARFDAVMVKELARLSGVTINVVDPGTSGDSEGIKKLEALASLAAAQGGPKRITFRFGLTPVAVEGEGGHVAAIRFRDGAGTELVLPCDAFLTAIGFEAGIDTLKRDFLIGGASDPESGVLAEGLYAAGWFRRGPRGTIPENRTDAQALAARILADLDSRPPVNSKAGRDVFAGLPAIVTYPGWQRIDAAERAAATPDRCRRKIASRAEMLHLATRIEEPQA